jgi:hypothetical protein
MLKANGKYEANKQMQKFASMSPSDSRAKAFRKSKLYQLLGKTKQYDVNSLDVSSDKAEFGQFYTTMHSILQALEMVQEKAMDGSMNLFRYLQSRLQYGWNYNKCFSSN